MMMASRSLRISSIAATPRTTTEPRPVIRACPRAGAADDLAAGRKVRTRNDVQKLIQRQVGRVDQGQTGVDDLAQIVRRDIGRHADGDAAGAVDQEIGDARRQNRRLGFLAVVVFLEVDRVACRGRPESPWTRGSGGIRCSASPPADRCPPSRSCPGRRSAAGSSRRAGPCARGCRRSKGRRAGDTCPSRRRPRAPISRRGGRACGPARSSNRGCGAERA